MKITLNVKQLGKKHAYIDKARIDIQGTYNTPCTLEEMLRAIVAQQVESFNKNHEDKSLLTFLQEGKINITPQAGQVTFGHTENKTQADSEKAIKVVLQGFADGLVAVFIDDEQIESLDQSVSLSEQSVLTLIRLTFLAGSIW